MPKFSYSSNISFLQQFSSFSSFILFHLLTRTLPSKLGLSHKSIFILQSWLESRVMAPAVQSLSDLYSARRVSTHHHSKQYCIHGVVSLVLFQSHKALSTYDDSQVGLFFFFFLSHYATCISVFSGSSSVTLLLFIFFAGEVGIFIRHGITSNILLQSDPIAFSGFCSCCLFGT